VVAVRATDRTRAAYLKRVQHAFCRGAGRTPEVLADLAADDGLDRAVFLAARSSAAKDAVRHDFSATQQTGVDGFPRFRRATDRRRFVTSGFARARR
jgi:protein-disulfide isomerase-like protein with CxxC motif